MCHGCWTAIGSPQMQSPEIREAAKAIEAVYQQHPAGGRLHVVIDDWNLEDEFMKLWDPENATDAEKWCLTLLAALTEDERASALALRDGYWGIL